MLLSVIALQAQEHALAEKHLAASSCAMAQDKSGSRSSNLVAHEKMESRDDVLTLLGGPGLDPSPRCCSLSCSGRHAAWGTGPWDHC